jgi:hypothetical protein
LLDTYRGAGRLARFDHAAIIEEVTKGPVFGWLTLLAACTPLVYPISYREIHGMVGYQLHARTRVLCADPQILSPAIIEQGKLPPGVELGAEGNLYGTPNEPGQWHAMVRLARMQCGDTVKPDDRVGWNFDIAPAPTPTQ